MSKMENTEIVKKLTCSICGSSSVISINKNKESYLCRCKNCKLLFREYFAPLPTDYGADYFEGDYKKQYGKTYKEDKDNLSALAQRRLDIIKRFKNSGNVLDLGSAFGFFLNTAKDYGYSVSGVEISGYASEYCKNELGIDVENKTLTDYNFIENNFDVITAWYVLEHIETLPSIIAKISASLKSGGILALSCPNGYGVSARFNIDWYKDIMPIDHAFEFSLKSIDILLNHHGLKRVYKENKSIYFSRFLKAFNIKTKLINNKLVEALYIKVAKVLNLGDTIECYYIKDKNS